MAACLVASPGPGPGRAAGAAAGAATAWTPIGSPPGPSPSGRSWRAPSIACTAALLCRLRAASGRAKAVLRGRTRVVTAQGAVASADLEDVTREISELLETQLGLARVPQVLQEAIDRLNDERDDGRGATECLTSVLDMLMDRKAFQMAVQLYLEWNSEVAIPLGVRCSIARLLGNFGNFQAAAGHVRELLESQEIEPADAAEIFNGILAGIIQARHPLTSPRADVLIKEMVEAGLQPTAETLRLVVEAKALYAAPGFLIDVGQSVLEIQRRFQTALQSSTLLAISGAHLRSGDLDAAYRWFLASQIIEDRQTLDQPAALELVSQLARALAIGGRALHLKRLLLRVKEDGGELPPQTAAVALSGFGCGRSLATCWLEPPPEVLRRRGIWASSPSAGAGATGVQVTMAEQWDWQQQEESRQEMYQWYPYMSPETKLERAWMTPLRSIDRGALGLALQWAGQTPAEAAARERLQDPGEPQSFDLESALALEPPGSSTSRGHSGRPVVLRPEPRTWRIYHADAVKKSFPTFHRTLVGSPTELREMLLAEKNTRWMMGAKAVRRPFPYTKIQEWVNNADEAMTSCLKSMQAQEIQNFSQAKVVKLAAQLSGMSEGEIEEEKSLTPAQLRYLLQTAARFAKGDLSVPLSDEDYYQKVLDMTDSELEEAYLTLKSSINDSILGDLTQQVEEQLLLERQEDAVHDGSAEDELRLALDVAKALQDLGLELSPADRKALLGASHALNDATLAQELLMALEPRPPTPAALSAAARSALGTAQEEMWRAMVRGGWDSESTKDFLRGQRLVPMRDRSTALGQLQTKYLDPLQGLSSTAPAEGLLKALQKPFEGQLKPYLRRTMPEDATTAEDRMNIVKDDAVSSTASSDRVSWEVKVTDPDHPENKVTQTVEVTKTHVLEAQALNPSTAELLSCLGRAPPRRSKPSPADVGKLLQEMGLPLPSRQDKKQELVSFVLSILT